jgi:protein-tyrosine phosphatase
MFETAAHWVRDLAPHRLGLMARPRGGDALADEVRAWQAASVGTVVSLLEAAEVRDLELRDQPRLCAGAGIGFRHFPIPDRGVPGSLKEVHLLVTELRAALDSGAVAIHCRAGIGRTGLVAGCVLHDLGVPVADIFHRLSRSRGLPMPDTSAQAD